MINVKEAIEIVRPILNHTDSVRVFPEEREALSVLIKDAESHEAGKEVPDYSLFTCRHHPTDGWHEVGCSHQAWSVEQLQSALVGQKRVVQSLQRRYFSSPPIAEKELTEPFIHALAELRGLIPDANSQTVSEPIEVVLEATRYIHDLKSSIAEKKEVWKRWLCWQKSNYP